MRTIMAVTVTIVCLVVLLQLQTLNAADEVKGPKVTEKVCGDDHENDNSNSTHMHTLVNSHFPVAPLVFFFHLFQKENISV